MTVTNLLRILIFSAVILVPFGAQAFDLEESLKKLHEQYQAQGGAYAPLAKGGGMSLDEAIASVRRRGDVERIISAETRRKGDREVHVIRYMTKDQKVRTAEFDGRRD
jgi:hypothetical protein